MQKPIKGRGATSNEASRFVEFTREAFDDGWDLDEECNPVRTQLFTENSRKIITYAAEKEFIVQG